jgi:hypothetical protein
VGLLPVALRDVGTIVTAVSAAGVLFALAPTTMKAASHQERTTMSDHFYQAIAADGQRRIFRIHIDEEEGRFRSLCAEVDERGDEKPGVAAVAPRFYGVSASQALRRMVQVLENSYEQLEEFSLSQA